MNKKSKIKAVRINTTLKAKNRHLGVLTQIENAVEKIEALPWNEWKHEFLTERNGDGSWLYKSLKDFADQKNINYKHLKICCSYFPRDSYPYYGDWVAMRSNMRFENVSANKKIAQSVAELDSRQKLLNAGPQTIEQCDEWIIYGKKMAQDAEAYFQSQMIMANEIWNKLSRNPKLRKEQLADRHQILERAHGNMEFSERCLKFVLTAMDSKLQAMDVANKIQKTENDRVVALAQTQQTQAQLPEGKVRRQLSDEDSIALKFFTGYKEFSENYGIEIPGMDEAVKIIDVEAKPSTIEMVEVGK